MTNAMDEKRVNAARQLFARANGAGSTAAIWSFSISLARLVLRVETELKEEVWIAANACTRLAGPVRWQSVSLELQLEDGRAVLFDETAGLRIVCAAIVAAGPGGGWAAEDEDDVE
jgi:hypothetical protein